MKFSVKIEDEVFTHSDSNEIVRIGRSDENDCILNNKELSRLHCMLELIKGSYYITDLKSKNGISIDGERIPPHEKILVTNNMQILLAGKFPLTFNDHQPTEEFTTTTATVGVIEPFPSQRERVFRKQRVSSSRPSFPKPPPKKPLPVNAIVAVAVVAAILLYLAK